MGEFLRSFGDFFVSAFSQFGVRDAIDILVIAFLLYRVLKWSLNTRTFQLLRGLAVLLIITSLTQILNLTVIAWVLNQIIRAGAIAIIVIFQPELRRGLEQIGRSKMFARTSQQDEKKILHTVNEITIAMKHMSEQRIGALIIIEQRTGLADIIATGTSIKGKVSASLIENIFVPNTPLHDGATIIHDDEILAAGCFLPLSDTNEISRRLGTRHRAAIGVSEVSDCCAFVVSEETGVISAAQNGKLNRYLDEKKIREMLYDLFTSESEAGKGGKSLLNLFKTMFGRKQDDPS